MTALKRQHDESMTALAGEREESQKRHEEAMAALKHQHDESMTALTELIRRTGSGENP